MFDGESIGFVVAGSFSEGLTFRLHKSVNIENIRIGDYVVVEGKNFDFLCLIEDIRLANTTDEVFFDPPKTVLEKSAISSFVYTEISIFPFLMFDKSSLTSYSKSIKTLPAHFSMVRFAKDEDFQKISKEETSLYIGTPLTSQSKMFIDLEKVAMRNTGLFGITGSGKSFLARILFSGLIKKNISSLLIFDMHNEHGLQTKDEKGNYIESLASVCRDRVKIFDVSAENKDASNYIVVPYSDINVEDIILIGDLLDFSEKSAETLEIVASKKLDDWFNFLLNEYPKKTEEEKKDIASSLGVDLSSLNALSRHLQKLRRLDFVRLSDETSSIENIIKNLKEGNSVVVQFSGKYRDDRLTYYFVSNILTRRIYNEFIKEEGGKRRVTIAVEEAHKFLSKQYQSNNVFGKIARELRKFNVTLFIIDQRPSEIDPEVLSQIGTRFVMELKDSKDIDAVFQGVGNEKRLSRVLSTLEQGQALVIGFAAEFPMSINVRKYDETFIKEIKATDITKGKKAVDDIY